MPVSLALAIAVAAGVAGGVFLDPAIVSTARWLVAGSVAVAFVMAAKGLLFIAKVLSLVTLMAACVIWGSHAEQQALHPPLRHLLEERLGGFSITAIDTERHDTPVVIEGRLTSDAYLTDNGATLRLTVDRVWLGDCPEFTRRRRISDDRRRAHRSIRDRVAGRTGRARARRPFGGPRATSITACPIRNDCSHAAASLSSARSRAPRWSR